MTERLVTAAPDTTQILPARLEPDAIGAGQDTIIGMANSAPTVAIGLSLAGLAAAAAYGSGPVIILCGIPMLVIANAYRRLNLWSANCGASFEWVGRAIDPYLGFLTGWLMIAASLIAAVAGVVVPAGRRRFPGLDRDQVVAERARVAAVVAVRHRHGRCRLDVRRASHPAVAVLPDPARERAEITEDVI